MQKDTRHDDLLSKHFSGELSTEERRQLDSWLAASPDHQQFASELKEVWDGVGSWQPQVSLNLDADFATIQQKIHGIETEPVVRAKRFTLDTTFLVRIAAAVVLLIFGFWGFQQWVGKGAAEVALVETVTEEAKTAITLSDGTKVWLRRAAKLSYPKQFTGDVRMVHLEGEAYFEVKPNPAKPFKVKMTDDTQVEVLGTKFLIKSPKVGAYTQVVVTEGKVRFSKGTKGVELTANETGIFNRSNGNLNEFSVKNLNDLAWQSGFIDYKDTPLAIIFSDLEKQFSVSIQLQNKVMAQCKINISSDRPIASIIEAIAKICEMSLEHPSENQYVLTGGDCPD
jgi:transmembrane sensor